MNRTKIEWADYVWNPVWGCRNHCDYCYARKFARRYGKEFAPEWKPKNYDSTPPKWPARIFVNSMSEIFYWQRPWMMRVLARVEALPHLQFLFLTKHPDIYQEYDWPANAWLGVTATCPTELYNANRVIAQVHHFTNNLTFLSLEPLLERIPADAITEFAWDWVIIGAESGNRRGRVVPKIEWIEELTDLPMPVFMKDSIKLIWDEPLRGEFPKVRAHAGADA